MIIIGDALTELKNLDSGSVQACITSPPYWNKVDYGVDGQYGLEPTPEDFVRLMCMVFNEVKRVLKDDGILWVNIDGTFAAGGKGGGGAYAKIRNSSWELRTKQTGWRKPPYGWTRKEYIPVPWMLGLALHEHGWMLRHPPIWAKTNGMMESCKDRFAHSHEYVLQLVKQPRYYFDHEASLIEGKSEPEVRNKAAEGYTGDYVGGERFSPGARQFGREDGKVNQRSILSGPTSTYRGKHRNTMPEWLATKLVSVSSRVGDVILDPFFGAGTTGYVAAKTGRKFIGIELNEKSAAEAEARINKAFPLFTAQ